MADTLDDEIDDVRQMLHNVCQGMRDKYESIGDEIAQQFVQFIRDEGFNDEADNLREELQCEVGESEIIDHLAELYHDLLSSDDQKQALQQILKGAVNQSATKPVIIQSKSPRPVNVPYRSEIFQNVSEDSDFCRVPKGNQTLTECCSHLQRICESLKYYDALKASDMDIEQKEQFVEFNMEIYTNILDDKAHLVKYHGNDLQKLYKEWTEKYGFSKCDVTKCAITSRHYRRESQEESDEKDSEQYLFFQEQYDSLHNYVVHLYDIGLRTDTEPVEREMSDDAKGDDLEMVTKDKAFKLDREKIKSAREKLNVPRNEDENNKYNIKANNTGDNRSKVTLSDALLKKLLKNDKMDMNDHQIQDFNHYLDENEMDSDFIEMDVEDLKDSNIEKKLQNPQAVRVIADLIHLVQGMFIKSECPNIHLIDELPVS